MVDAPDDRTPVIGASEREQRVRASVESLFRHCSANENPPLAFSQACSKIGYLARDGVRTDLHHLESALNEQKHALLLQRIGNTVKASEHAKERDRHLRSFGTAVRRSLVSPKDPPSTPELRGRIHCNLEAGQWNRARLDLDELARRADIGRPLPDVDEYPRASSLGPQRFAALQERAVRCNANAHLQNLQRASDLQHDRRNSEAYQHELQQAASVRPVRSLRGKDRGLDR
jgi:hypothetical protein